MRYDSSAIVVCTGHGAARRRIVERLADLGVTSDRSTRVVHPSVDVPDGCTVGDGSILLSQVVLTAHVMVDRTAPRRRGWVTLPSSAPGNDDVWHLYVVRVDDRDQVANRLSEAGAGVGVHYPSPCT